MAFEKITSMKNEGIRELLALRDRNARDAAKLTVIDGNKEIQAALEAGVKFRTLYICEEMIERKSASWFLARFAKMDVNILAASRPVFAKIAFGERMEGMVAVAHQPRLRLNDLKLSANALLVLVEGVEKPGNLGAILRTCDAAGADGLIVCEGRTDVYNPNVIRASLGAVFTVPVISCENQEALDFCKAKKVLIFGAFPEAKELYTKGDYRRSSAVILGSEHNGLTSFWSKNADAKVSIPMTGKVNSLNVATSAAIILYEAVRQRM